MLGKRYGNFLIFFNLIKYDLIILKYKLQFVICYKGVYSGDQDELEVRVGIDVDQEQDQDND